MKKYTIVYTVSLTQMKSLDVTSPHQERVPRVTAEAVVYGDMLHYRDTYKENQGYLTAV